MACGSTAATYDLETLRLAIDAAHAAGARVAVHSTLPDSGLAGIGADSIEHGQALGHAELAALGVRGGAWTPTLCALLQSRDPADPAVRTRVGELRERLRDYPGVLARPEAVVVRGVRVRLVI